MRNLILEEKTGFLTSLPFEINDNRGILFYSSDFTDHISRGDTLKFNLPLGVYSYNGSFVKLSSPISTVKIDLPPRERNINNGKKYKIIFGSNPNKCTIFYEPGIILFDNSFRDAPLYIKYGIYFHELGHHFYSTEKYADIYAAKKMLDYGFNPSQIGRMGLDALTKEESIGRKVNLVNELTKDKRK